MLNGKPNGLFEGRALAPLEDKPQLGARVYQALLQSIVAGQIESGAPLRPDLIARQLEVSTTPVREAMQRLEGDGLAVKLPNRGWFVREFTTGQIRELYEVRTALECMAVRLACTRATDEELSALETLHSVGQAALAADDREAYRIYNQDLHAAILQAARNSYLSSVMAQLRVQNEMLMVKTTRIAGRSRRAFEEHGRILDLMMGRRAPEAEKAMRAHVLDALQALIQSEARGRIS